ncbi:helix-turn-helix transcriptional regulator [Ancylobacter sp. IITR112]|uniref:S24 family peptidase n=1 Tax=Ancylobacter sp. IITR112 TaxID=3138073 RepID=UPI00352B86FE
MAADYAGHIPHLSTGYVPFAIDDLCGNNPAMNRPILSRIEARLAVVRETDGKSEAAVCREAGLGRDAIRDIRRREGVLPRLDTLAALAVPLRTTPEWLAFGRGWEDPGLVAQGLRPVPLVSWVAASAFAETTFGAGLPADLPTINVPDLPAGEYIALKVQGDSMNRIAVDGSTIIVRLNDKELLDRAFYVFMGTDGTTFKRYRAKEGPQRLEAYSTSDHPTIYPSERIEVVGRVIRVITDLYRPGPARL